jgi:hypothetical protein
MLIGFRVSYSAGATLPRWSGRPPGGALGGALHLRGDIQQVDGADAGADSRFERRIRCQAGTASYVEDAQVPG